MFLSSVLWHHHLLYVGRGITLRFVNACFFFREGNEGSSNIDNEDADGEEICCQSDPEAESDEETNPVFF